MHHEFGIINSYTLEISFCGATQGVHKDTHFSQKLLKVSISCVDLSAQLYMKVLVCLEPVSLRS